MKKAILFVALAGFFGGCSTDGTMNLSGFKLFSSRAEQAVAAERVNLSNGGNYWDALTRLGPFLNDGDSEAKVTINLFLAEDPEFISKAIKFKADQIVNLKFKHEIIPFRNQIDDISISNIVSLKERKYLHSVLNETIESKNKNGDLDFTLYDNFYRKEPLNTPEHVSIIFDRTLRKLREASGVSDRQLKRVLMFLRGELATEAQRDRFKAAVPSLSLTPAQIVKDLEFLVPDYVNETRERLTVVLYIKVKPKNRLLEIDLVDKLSEISPFLTIVAGSVPGKDERSIQLIIDELDYRESEPRPSTVTRRIPDYEVRFLAAALLMPEDSTYMYDVTTAHAQIDFAYEMTLFDGDVESYRKLIRDKVVANTTTCSNTRIQNVFGGVQSANFVANDKMKSECSYSGESIDMGKLRAAVLSHLASDIKSIPQVRKAILADY